MIVRYAVASVYSAFIHVSRSLMGVERSGRDKRSFGGRGRDTGAQAKILD